MDKVRGLLKAYALRDGEAAARLSEGFTPEDRREYHYLAMALFSIVAAARLGENPSPADLDGLVEELRYDYRDLGPDQINYLHVTGALQALYGKDYLLEDMTPDEQVKAFLPVVVKIAAQSTEVRERLDDSLDDAERLVEDWKRGA
ncbi:hypothetical protein [Salininema proteolyticum]|uniref:Uncharacterized protein n=1 Tax=Salininema proteolyticum TaxID=1607685 RepID=A0ABV8U2X3_9ACTN